MPTSPYTRTYIPSNADSLRVIYDGRIQERVLFRKRSLPFIDEAFHPEFRLFQGVTLVGALTGQAKSTTNANILAGFLNSNTDKKAFVISNEESLDSVYNRVACIRLKYSFNSYHKGMLSPHICEEIENEARSLMSRIYVVNQEKGWDMTFMEDVQAVLNYVAAHPDEISLVTIDYLQTIASSRENRTLTQYEISKRMGAFFKNYGTRTGAPIVVFAQLKNQNADVKAFKNRIEGDNQMLNHVIDAIEIVPDFQNLTTKFIIQKSRFGIPQGTSIDVRFDNGRYEFEDKANAEMPF